MGEFQAKHASLLYTMGIIPIPLEKGRKKPVRFDWSETSYNNINDVMTAFAGEVNVGILLGSKSNNFVDVDLDCIESVRLAPQFLPETGMKWGRNSKPISHWGYRVASGELRRQTYNDVSIDGGEAKVLLEIRGDGHQTMAPPSIHPDGETIQFYTSDTPATIGIEELLASTGNLAAASLLAKNWNRFGSRHYLAMHLAGALARTGWTEVKTDFFITNIATAAGDDEVEDRRTAVRDTYLSLEEDSPTSGWPTLRDIVGEEVVNKIRAWLRIQEKQTFPLNDLGNAQRFLALHGEDVRYCADLGHWLVWDGRRWIIDRNETIVGSKSLTVPRFILKEAAEEQDEERSKSLAKWALTTGLVNRVNAITKIAQDMPDCWVQSDDLDRDLYKLNVTNGVLNLRTGGLEKPHNKQEYITQIAGTSYSQNASAPRFEMFLETIFNGNEDLIRYVQKLAGYSLTGSTDEQIFPILYGSGANGKSTLLEIIREVMGEYCQVADATTFLQQTTDRIRTDLARMRGARLVTSSEVSQDRKLDTALVKAITGGDKITARFLFKNDFEYIPGYKVWLATNYKPSISGDDEGMWRRLRLIPFEVKIPEEKQDKSLKQKIISSELPGVLTWMVEGCVLWQKEGLIPPSEVLQATAHYKDDSDVVKIFIDDACIRDPQSKIAAKALYAAFQIWCKSSGVRYVPIGQFKDRMASLGFTMEKVDNAPGYVGISTGMPIMSNAPAGLEPTPEYGIGPNPFMP